MEDSINSSSLLSFSQRIIEKVQLIYQLSVSSETEVRRQPLIYFAMANLLLCVLFFSGMLFTLTIARPDPSPARLGLLEVDEEALLEVDAVKAPPLRLLVQLSPSSAPEIARHPRRQASKVELTTAKLIAAGFISAFVVAAFVYIRVTRKRATENSKY